MTHEVTFELRVAEDELISHQKPKKGPVQAKETADAKAFG